MLRQILTSTTVMALATAIAVGSASAQKSKNTVRVAVYDTINKIDLVEHPQIEVAFAASAIFDSLLAYDTQAQKFKPRIAESWKRINATTWELKLRKGLKFHDGSTLDADDVVYTINYISDPKVRFRLKSRFLWIKRAEKMDQHNVRLVTKRPYSVVLPRIARSFYIYPSDVHGALKTKSDFGKNPVGSGPYRATMVDPNRGTVLEKVKSYALAAPYNPAGSVQRYELKPIPDAQTQVAHLLTGGVDIMYRVPKDLVESLTATGNFKATVKKTGIVYFYIALDAVGRSGVAPLKKLKVRQAIMTAIDRKSIQNKLVAGGSELPLVGGMCFRHQIGCDYSSKLPAYDPVKAKKLLAEAGNPDFSVDITSVTNIGKQVPTVIAGYLRAIGIKATVSSVPFPAYRKRQQEGKINVLVSSWSSGGLPDVGSTLDFFWAKGARNLSNDPVMFDLLAKSNQEFDTAKRRELNRQMFNRTVEQAYIHPITVVPPVFVHHKDLVINETGGDFPIGAMANEIRWR